MSRNGSGTYSLPAGNPVVTGTTISSTWSNTTLTDIANALTGSLASDGQTTASGNLNMGTNRITNAGNPTNQQDVATKYYTDEAIAAAEATTLAAITPANVSDKVNTATGYFQVPKGTVLQRPLAPANGIVRYNTELDLYEGYIDGDWVTFQTFSQSVYTANYVVVSGGGGGSAQGGAGAGGRLASTLSFTPSVVYTFVIGAGGAASGSGGASSITSLLTTVGGGSGNSGNGGSGGGSQGGSAGNFGPAAGSGTSGQGFAGGVGYGYAGGGGGGAGAIGGTGGPETGGAGFGTAGAGGVGVSTLITGSTIFLAGGGGGGAGFGGTPAAGGNGGGGAGSNGPTGGAGTVNTGGGGGGGDSTGGAGGSGVIYISVPTVNYTGTTTGSPVVTTTGANTVMKFTTSGTYTA